MTSNTANLANCKRLYELSRWAEPYFAYYDYDDDNHWGLEKNVFTADGIPAYDSDYLLGKLPAWFRYDGHDNVYLNLSPSSDDSGDWFATYSGPNNNIPSHPGKSYEYDIKADTPADALCLLSIQLFENGVLK